MPSKAKSNAKPKSVKNAKSNGKGPERIHVKHCVIGAGSAGINALRQIRRKTQDVVWHWISPCHGMSGIGELIFQLIEV